MHRLVSAGVCLLAIFRLTSAAGRETGPEPSPPTDPAGSPTPTATAAPIAEAKAEELVVTARKPLQAASSKEVRDRDFLLRPHPRPADVLMVTPGLYVVQHAGGGKANQYFLRGFDADHGTDVALSVDGVPVNMVSHGHGQGYADLNWLIPEVVETIEVSKGPYDASHGDFATAGAVNLVTREGFEAHRVSVGGGMFGTYRTLLVTSPTIPGWKPFVAVELHGTDGPFDRPERLQRFGLFGKVSRELEGGSSLSLAATGYGAGWNASGQIPLRELRRGDLDRFGTVDETEGGNSERYSLYGSWRARGAAGDEMELLAYAASYRLSLFSNFTFFRRDRVNGDQIEQQDRRTLFGVAGRWRRQRLIGATVFDTTLGFRTRTDRIENGLYRDRERERMATVVDASIDEASLGVHAQEEIVWTPWLRTVVGGRVDRVDFRVDDRLEDLSTQETRTSGVAQKTLLSPKASAILSPLRDTDLFLNVGTGFHSNDARGVVRGQDAVTPLTRAIGYELGARTRLLDRVDLAAALFRIDLDSEIVWVGDEGVTEASGATRRDGVEIEARARLLPWLFADADANFVRAEFTRNPGNADAVALAPTRLVSGGISARHPAGWYGRLGALHIGDRPATEDRFLTAEGFTRVDLSAGYRRGRWEVSTSVQNLTNTEWREAQFATVSRLADEETAADCPPGTRARADGGGAFDGCEDLHFTPGAPINVQATATLHF